MSSRKLLMLILALAIAVGAIVLARQALKPNVDENGQVVEEVKGPQVLVAARDLNPGTLLKETDMKWQAWSEEPRENMIRKDQGGNKDDLNGSLLRHAVKMGEPLYDNRIFKTSEQGFLSAALSPGMRAISIKITPVSGLAGLVFPGDHVDVIVAHNVPVPGPDGQQRDRRVSETVVSNARVLGLDQKTDEKVSEPKIADVATIEVTPKDAEKIALIADWSSTISLVLRSLSDSGASVAPTPAPVVVMPDLTAAGIAMDKTQATAPETVKGHTYTWDSDVSKVLPRPDSATNVSRRVLVIRGKDSAEVSFQQ